MKILVLTRYTKLGASSRFRFFQYFTYLENNGCDLTVEPLLQDNYIKYLYEKTPAPYLEIITAYLKRVLNLLQKKNYDLIWLQQEAFPWIPAWFEIILTRSRIPIVVDYDDAFFHRYDLNNSSLVRLVLEKKIDSVMNYANVVVAGNNYLAERAIKSGCNDVRILPTVVNLNQYPVVGQFEGEDFIIGWIGSPHTAKYLELIKEPLRILSLEKNVRILLVGAGDFSMNDINFEKIDWKEKTEAEDIQKFDVGIMPLIDSPWERGKCGFKLIQYMASVKPVIASPVGVNNEIVQNSVNGFLANSSEEWIKYFKILKNDFILRQRMGLAGRKIVEEKYSLQITALKLFNIFQDLIKK
jgi:glycosyltransferase involved in cell wall biosynthesis